MSHIGVALTVLILCHIAQPILPAIYLHEMRAIEKTFDNFCIHTARDTTGEGDYDKRSECMGPSGPIIHIAMILDRHLARFKRDDLRIEGMATAEYQQRPVRLERQPLHDFQHSKSLGPFREAMRSCQ